MYSPEVQKELFERSKNYLNADSAERQQTTKEQLGDLVQLLVYHEWRYYVKNDPVISDFEYDTLFKQLEAIEAAHPELVRSDSPTQRVSVDLTADFPEVEHLTPMLSLANSYNADDLRDFDAQIKRFVNLPEDEDVAYVVEPKYDGGSIAVVYENDDLTRGATRGNGRVGEEMTANARVIRSVPLKAAFSKYGIQKAELRGEVLIRKDQFKKINEERAKEGLTLFANPQIRPPEASV